MAAYHALIWVFPAMSLLLYIVFGSEFFLFRFTDDLSLYFVTKATSRWSFTTHILTALILLVVGLNYND